MTSQERPGLGRVAVAVAIATIVILAGIATFSYLTVARSSEQATSVQSSSASSASSLGESTAQYPLVWGPNPVSPCAGIAFCVYATLGLSSQTGANSASSATTVNESNANASYTVELFAYVQDAVTGQNATTPSGIPVVGSSCTVQSAGFTRCIVGAPYMPGVSSGDPYKVTVFVTMNYLPCSLQKAGLQCSSQLLAPPSPTVAGDFEG